MLHVQNQQIAASQGFHHFPHYQIYNHQQVYRYNQMYSKSSDYCIFCLYLCIFVLVPEWTPQTIGFSLFSIKNCIKLNISIKNDIHLNIIQITVIKEKSQRLTAKINKQQDRVIGIKMLQSFSTSYLNHMHHHKHPNLRCHRCTQKPNQQFILLLCDHVICANCLDQFNFVRENQYDGIKCTCGKITYFKNNDATDSVSASFLADQQGSSQTAQTILNIRATGKFDQSNHNMLLQSNTGLTHSKNNRNRSSKHANNGESDKNITVSIHNKSSNNKKQNEEINERKTKNGNCLRASAGLIHSKNTISTKNISRLNTQSFGCQNILNDSGAQMHKQNLLQKDGYMLQRSRYPLYSKSYKNVKQHNQQQNSEINKNSIKEFSPSIQQDDSRVSSKNNKFSYNKKDNIAKNKLNETHYEPKLIDSLSISQDKQIQFPLFKNQKQKQNLNPNLKNKERAQKGRQSKEKREKNQRESKNISSFNKEKENNNEAISEYQKQDSFKFTIENSKMSNKLKSIVSLNSNANNMEKIKMDRKQLYQSQLSKQIKQQLLNIKEAHAKNIESLQRQYQKIIDKLNRQYYQLQNQIKDFYLQSLLLNQSQTRIDLENIIKQRYLQNIGENVDKFLQYMKMFNFSCIRPNDDSNLEQISKKSNIHRHERFSSPQPHNFTNQSQNQKLCACQRNKKAQQIKRQLFYLNQRQFAMRQKRKQQRNNNLNDRLNRTLYEGDSFRAPNPRFTDQSYTCSHSCTPNLNSKLVKKPNRKRTNIVIQLE